MKKPSENLFKGGDNGLHNNCLKCGNEQKLKNCFKFFDWSGIFCYKSLILICISIIMILKMLLYNNFFKIKKFNIFVIIFIILYN